MNKEQFQLQLEKKGIILSPTQLDQFQQYYQILVEWNQKMNLTAITEEEEVYVKHFYDSISAAFSFDFSQPARLCDVGAGAGFPSIPLKICFPHIHVTIVDSLQKRISFLHHLATSLRLDGVSFYHDRAETFARQEEMREQFDIVTARAVARLSVLSELCLPLVKVGGTFIAMKAATAEEEIRRGEYAVQVLGGQVTKMDNFQLPLENGERNILLINKQKCTPKKYPRKPGVPNKLPIEK